MKPGEQGEGGGGAEEQEEGAVEEGRERDADRRGHDQPQLVVGMVVVDAVDDEVHAVAEFVVGLPVEDQPVQPVLGQGPDRDAAQGEQEKRPEAEAAVGSEPLHRHHDRHEDDRRDSRVDPREVVEKGAVEHLRGGRQALASLMRSHRRILAARWAPSGGGRKARGSCKNAPAKKEANCGIALCGGLAAVLTWPRAGGQAGETEIGFDRERSGIGKAQGWSGVFEGGAPARTATSAGTSSAPWIWTSPAPPSGPTAPRASCLRASRCC